MWRSLLGLGTVHEIAEPAAVSRCVRDVQPAVLLLDLAMLGPRGVASLPAIGQLSSSTKIVAITSAFDEREGLSALHAGASGYCEKTIKLALLQKAVRLVQRGQIWAGRRLIEYLLKELRSAAERLNKTGLRAHDDALELTPRERDIIRMLQEGRTNKEIAIALNIAERTVKNRLTILYRKLGVPSRLHLALLVSSPRAATVA